jgi:hypothetical protein
MTHLSPEEYLDLADGVASTEAVAHAAACESCRRELAALREALGSAVAAGRDVPEPSPFFWEALSARVRAAVAAEVDDIGGRAWLRGRWRWAAAGSAVAAALVAALWLSAAGRTTMPPNAAESDRVGAQQAAMPVVSEGRGGPGGGDNDRNGVDDAVPFEQDPSLTLLGDLAAEIEWESAVAAGLHPAEGAVEQALAALDDNERAALQQLLQESLARSQSGV